MSRQLWLLRYGATEWALNGRHTGSTDLPLLPEGEAEARALGPVLSQQQFAAVFSSPLQRAQRTCELAGLGDRMQSSNLSAGYSSSQLRLDGFGAQCAPPAS